MKQSKVLNGDLKPEHKKTTNSDRMNKWTDTATIVQLWIEQKLPRQYYCFKGF